MTVETFIFDNATKSCNVKINYDIFVEVEIFSLALFLVGSKKLGFLARFLKVASGHLYNV